MINKTPGTLVIYSNKNKIKQAFTVDRPEALPDTLTFQGEVLNKTVFTLKDKENIKLFNIEELTNLQNKDNIQEELNKTADLLEFNRIAELINSSIIEDKNSIL